MCVYVFFWGKNALKILHKLHFDCRHFVSSSPLEFKSILISPTFSINFCHSNFSFFSLSSVFFRLLSHILKSLYETHQRLDDEALLIDVQWECSKYCLRHSAFFLLSIAKSNIFYIYRHTVSPSIFILVVRFHFAFIFIHLEENEKCTSQNKFEMWNAKVENRVLNIWAGIHGVLAIVLQK